MLNMYLGWMYIEVKGTGCVQERCLCPLFS
jgi:hypothetical protein